MGPQINFGTESWITPKRWNMENKHVKIKGIIMMTWMGSYGSTSTCKHHRQSHLMIMWFESNFKPIEHSWKFIKKLSDRWLFRIQTKFVISRICIIREISSKYSNLSEKIQAWGVILNFITLWKRVKYILKHIQKKE